MSVSARLAKLHEIGNVSHWRTGYYICNSESVFFFCVSSIPINNLKRWKKMPVTPNVKLYCLMCSLNERNRFAFENCSIAKVSFRFHFSTMSENAIFGELYIACNGILFFFVFG